MPAYSTTKFVFPVFGTKVPKEGESNSISNLHGNVYGSAFSIGGGFFLTATHVMKSATDHEFPGLGYLTTEGYTDVYKIQEAEMNEDIDVTIFRVNDFPKPITLKISKETVSSIGLDVVTAGYAYGLDRDVNSVIFRAFKGNIVSGRYFNKLKGNPGIYELSFLCPKGLSGSPVFLDIDDVKIIGMIITNLITEMTVSSVKEVIADGKETIFERSEAMHLGIAIATASFVNIKFRLLDGKSVYEHHTEYVD